MNRLFSALLLATFLSQTIGFGWPITLPVFSEGNFSVRVAQINKYFGSDRVPAEFSGSTEQHEYNSLVMVGDVLLARNIEYLMRTKGGDYPFSGIELATFGQDAAVIGNFEAAIPKEHTPTPIGIINFSVPTSSIPYLAKAKFSHLSLANNHSYDYEQEGFLHTRDILSEHVSPFGHPNEIEAETYDLVAVNNKTVALIGINGLKPIREGDLQRLFNRLSNLTDFQIVYVHWGEEYALRHNDYQKAMAEKFVSLGADLIVGHHPHVVQGVDLIDGVPVFYSLGNYVFDQYFSKDVQEGLVISVSLKDGLAVSLIPVTSKTTLSQPNLMPEQYHAGWLENLARKSHPDLQKQIESGFIDLGSEIATSPKVAIMHDTKAYVQ